MTAQPANSYTVQEAAHALGIGEHTLFRFLRRHRILNEHNAPQPKYKTRGYLVEREGSYKHPAVGVRFYSRTYVTDAGLAWLRVLLNNDASADERAARLDRLLTQIANMNPDAGEIGGGMLRHIVQEARDLTGTQQVPT